MTTLSLRLPDSYHTMVKEISAKDKISINQFIISAVAEKISALETQNYLEERAARGSRDKFMAVLAKVPNTEPSDYDR
jgi:predicted DNA-binding ribbon-helix-helix protein